MIQEILYSLDTPYRQKFEIQGFRFGHGEKSCAIVGGLRGNEIQQMYVCSQLVKVLKKLEQQGAVNSGHEILIVPCINHFSMNVGTRFWPLDNTDINRMFPGYDQGETTQRIAAALFGAVKDYKYGIHFASYYLPGDFVPHVRIMDTGYESAGAGNLFGLPYVVLRQPQPFDTTTLNYNWQIWETNAFSIFAKGTDYIDDESAKQTVSAVLRFLSRMGIIKYKCHNGFLPTIIKEEELAYVNTNSGGILHRLVFVGDEVEYGQVMAEVLDPLTGEVIEEVTSPTVGIVFFSRVNPLVTEHETVFRVIRRIHN